MSLKTFVGFRGVAMHLEVDGIRFYVLAKDNTEAESLYNFILPDAPAFDPAMCKKAILIESKLLPQRATPKKTKTQTSESDSHDNSNSNRES